MKEKIKKNANQLKNKSVSENLLDSYRGALMKIEEWFRSVQDKEFDSDNVDENMKLIQGILMASERLGKAIETLAVLEKKVASDEQMSNKRRGTETTAMFED